MTDPAYSNCYPMAMAFPLPPGIQASGGLQYATAGGTAACVSQVEMHIQCRNLLDKDVFSLSDPMVVVYVEQMPGMWKEIGRTETIWNTLNPEFSRTFVLDYYFEEVQKLKFEVYDIDSVTSQLSDHDFLGHMQCTLGEIVASSPFTRPLLSWHGSRMGSSTITIRAEEIKNENRNLIKFSFKATKLDRKDFFGKSDPFLEIRKEVNGSWQMIHRTEAIKYTLNPVWKPFEIRMQSLGGENVEQRLLVSCFDYNNSGRHSFIGEFHTTFGELLEAQHKQMSWPCINPKKKEKKGSSYKNSGVIHLTQCQVIHMYSFLDYIFGGTQLNFVVAIDFTASNGDPRDPRSLHYISETQPNQYVNAIWAVGNVIRDYDSDKMFPALGFGAKIPPKWEVSHEFAVNFNMSNPFCSGIEGILDAYHACIRSVQLYGPTNFAPIINHVARFAQQAQQEASCTNYYILLMLTDGVITDMDNTRRAIVHASFLPMSIIIVGVGKADFTAMDFLDSDDKLLSSPEGQVAARDIVQFVPFYKYEYGPPGLLAKEVLAEVPDQVTGYYRMKNIPPLSRRQVSVPVL